MAKFRNIRVRKAGGGSRIQRAMVLKSGKLRFVKTITKRRSSPQTHSRRKTSRRSTTMARRRKTSSRRRKGAFGLRGLGGKVVAGIGYGIVRQPLSTLTRQIPIPIVGGLGDEVALLAVSAFLSTQTKGIIRQIGNAGVYIESHNIGRNLGGGLLGGGTTSGPANNLI